MSGKGYTDRATFKEMNYGTLSDSPANKYLIDILNEEKNNGVRNKTLGYIAKNTEKLKKLRIIRSVDKTFYKDVMELYINKIKRSANAKVFIEDNENLNDTIRGLTLNILTAVYRKEIHNEQE